MAEKESAGGVRSDFDAMMADMQKRFNEMMAGFGGAGRQIIPALRGTDVRVDVMEHGDEILITADLPGVASGDISVMLQDPRTLRITARREEAMEEEHAGFIVRERMTGDFTRTIGLPAEVSDEGAQATFKNGVLHIRLMKIPKEEGIKIPLSEEGEHAGMAMGPSAEEKAARHRQQVEEEYKEARERIEPSGYMSAAELKEKAAKIQIEENLSPEEAKTAAAERKRKEREYEEGKKKLG
jgi:HSP20 family protein